MSEPLVTNIRGRHAASDNQIIVRDGDGKITGAIKNHSTRIDSTTTEVIFSSACGGTVCLRIDDNKHSDFWMELNLDIPTLERLLAEAKESAQLQHLLFPQLEGDLWAEVNLNAVALEYDQQETRSTAENDAYWVNELHKKLDVDHSWGGWMEHRDHLLRHHYNKDVGTDHFWHLGIDYNVPEHTNVHLPCDAELVYYNQDTDQNGGWGGKLIFKYAKGYFILGHLDQLKVRGRPYRKGEIVGRVADPRCNGNWFPHLHIQCMRELDVNVDGYSHRYDGIKDDYPDPRVMLENNIERPNHKQ